MLAYAPLIRPLATRQCIGSITPGLHLRMAIRSYSAASISGFAKRAVVLSRTASEKHQQNGRLDSRVLALIGGTVFAAFATKSSIISLDSIFDGKKSSRGYAIGRDEDSFFNGNEDKDFPKSDVNVYNLGFGSVCGICAGVFIKKGLKFIAFILGGGFILLQYLNTQRIINVNWRALSRRYDSAVQSAAGQDAIEVNKPSHGWQDSTAARIWNRFTHFLTADFPSRGTFLAGLLLGLRLG